jgi:hypothetical protein
MDSVCLNSAAGGGGWRVPDKPIDGVCLGWSSARGSTTRGTTAILAFLHHCIHCTTLHTARKHCVQPTRHRRLHAQAWFCSSTVEQRSVKPEIWVRIPAGPPHWKRHFFLKSRQLSERIVWLWVSHTCPLPFALCTSRHATQRNAPASLRPQPRSPQSAHTRGGPGRLSYTHRLPRKPATTNSAPSSGGQDQPADTHAAHAAASNPRPSLRAPAQQTRADRSAADA